MGRFLFVCLLSIAGIGFSGCLKRPPANVYPGSEAYANRSKEMKISPSQAYQIAREAAAADGQLHFISRAPTVVVKRWYVFSMPLPSGANLQGYHVNGDTGEVKFVSEKKIIPHTSR